MRRFISMAAALAIVVVAAVAILASGEVLSFSTPGSDVSVGDKAPADQAQPQDYYGEATRGFYFGPDFMCAIYSNTTTIECYGSNTHGVVSSTPQNAGFSFIDGGDTYACAYNQSENFHYCWGSITLRPSTTQPTATSEPTATPEATATALPPGVTPEPTATSAPQATATPVPDPCRIVLPDSFILPLTQTGSWIEDCVYPFELENIADGDRYFRYALITASVATRSWVATLTSDEDTVLVLSEWNAETEEWDFIEQNDDLAQGNTNSRIEWTPVQGKSYALDLTTYNATTLGDFTLTVEAGTASGQSSGMEQNMGQSDLQGAVPFERRQ